jgi:hypothetical protein
MTWLNPWAWLGLAALAVPVLVHLLARASFTPVPFPTLRFLRASTLVDVRRKRLTDLALLAVRCAIVALAAAALAQPFIVSRDASEPARLVIVDTSASVDAAAAREAATPHASATPGSEVIERRSLADALREAAGWASARSTAAPIVIVSDFQRGALDAGLLAALPSNAAVTLHRVARRDLRGEFAGVARAGAQGTPTSAVWAAPPPADAIRVESTLGETVGRAMAEAARSTAAAHGATLRPATFVLSDAPNRDSLADESQPANAPWMFDVIASITPGRARTVKQIGGRAIVFLATSDPAVAADAIREAIPALSAGPPPSEFEPATLSDDELRRLERPAAPGATPRRPDRWAGRWLWIAALLLLGVEQMMRRGSERGEELAHAA